MNTVPLTLSGRAWRLFTLMVLATPTLSGERRRVWEKRLEGIHPAAEYRTITMHLDATELLEAQTTAERIGSTLANLTQLLDRSGPRQSVHVPGPPATEGVKA